MTLEELNTLMTLYLKYGGLEGRREVHRWKSENLVEGRGLQRFLVALQDDILEASKLKAKANALKLELGLEDKPNEK